LLEKVDVICCMHGAAGGGVQHNVPEQIIAL
jgi:hypothetical protein